ncbi:MAG TPA: winged helix-turn-helix domain-containing protein [Vicinamibacterales bacterium]|nr:winged helix-turn-helix domain-containing protein [Vicinamibacterales bacterium]
MQREVICFGEFELNLRARELSKHGERIRLQDQPFLVLAMLLERPGDVVTRDEIRARLWPDGTTVDFDHSVNAAIKRLRAALGDLAERPHYVETLHRRGYRLIAPLVPSAATEHLSPARIKPRVIVLPFDNLSEAPAQDYFSDGLTEEMIAQLGRLFGSRVGVIARTSSMQLKGAKLTAGEIGRTTGTEYLVEGSVRRDRDRVRITAQLIETRGETHLWAQSYERELSDMIGVQTDVAAAIASSLMIELLPGAGPAPLSGTQSADAHQAYLKGRFHWNRPGDAGLQAAMVYFDEAIALDPSYAAAHAGRSRCYISMAEYYHDTPRNMLELARAAAERALEIDAWDPEANIARAECLRAADWDSAGAEAAYQRAFVGNASFHAAHRYYAQFLAVRGRLDEAAVVADRASELDPFCMATSLSLALVHSYAGQYEPVISRCLHILDMDPEFVPARRVMAAALGQLGRHQEALDELQLLTSRPQDPVSAACFGHALAIAGERRRAEAVRQQINDLTQRQFVPALYTAMLDAGLGDLDRAFANLETAGEQRDPWLDTVAVDPRFAPLRVDPRFGSLMSRIGLKSGYPLGAT